MSAKRDDKSSSPELVSPVCHDSTMESDRRGKRMHPAASFPSAVEGAPRILKRAPRLSFPQPSPDSSTTLKNSAPHSQSARASSLVFGVTFGANGEQQPSEGPTHCSSTSRSPSGCLASSARRPQSSREEGKSVRSRMWQCSHYPRKHHEQNSERSTPAFRDTRQSALEEPPNRDLHGSTEEGERSKNVYLSSSSLLSGRVDAKCTAEEYKSVSRLSLAGKAASSSGVHSTLARMYLAEVWNSSPPAAPLDFSTRGDPAKKEEDDKNAIPPQHIIMTTKPSFSHTRTALNTAKNPMCPVFQMPRVGSTSTEKEEKEAKEKPDKDLYVASPFLQTEACLSHSMISTSWNSSLNEDSRERVATPPGILSGSRTGGRKGTSSRQRAIHIERMNGIPRSDNTAKCVAPDAKTMSPSYTSPSSPFSFSSLGFEMTPLHRGGPSLTPELHVATASPASSLSFGHSSTQAPWTAREKSKGNRYSSHREVGASQGRTVQTARLPPSSSFQTPRQTKRKDPALPHHKKKADTERNPSGDAAERMRNNEKESTARERKKKEKVHEETEKRKQKKVKQKEEDAEEENQESTEEKKEEAPQEGRSVVYSRPADPMADDDGGKFGNPYPEDDERYGGATGSTYHVIPTATLEERLEYLSELDTRRWKKEHLKAMREQNLPRRPETLIRTKYGPLKTLTYGTEGSAPLAITASRTVSQVRETSAPSLFSTREAPISGMKAEKTVGSDNNDSGSVLLHHPERMMGSARSGSSHSGKGSLRTVTPIDANHRKWLDAVMSIDKD